MALEEARLARHAARADEGLGRLLAGGGQVALLRHATTTPGVGDPTGFRVDDRVTQPQAFLTLAGEKRSGGNLTPQGNGTFTVAGRRPAP